MNTEMVYEKDFRIMIQSSGEGTTCLADAGESVTWRKYWQDEALISAREGESCEANGDTLESPERFYLVHEKVLLNWLLFQERWCWS